MLALARIIVQEALRRRQEAERIKWERQRELFRAAEEANKLGGSRRDSQLTYPEYAMTEGELLQQPGEVLPPNISDDAFSIDGLEQVGLWSFGSSRSFGWLWSAQLLRLGCVSEGGFKCPQPQLTMRSTRCCL